MTESPAAEDGPLAQFCLSLKMLRQQSGLSCVQLARSMSPELAKWGKTLSATRINEIENGRKIKGAPDGDVVRVWVRICRGEAERKGRPVSVPTLPAFWEKELERLADALATEQPTPLWRSEHRSADPNGQRLTQLLRSPTVPPVDEVHRTPSYYLDPARRVVEFAPRPELAVLTRWCGHAAQQFVRVVHGPGGTGKTRLGIELGVTLARDPDWIVGQLPTRSLGLLPELGELLGEIRPQARVLLCIDDAEDWAAALPEFLVRLHTTGGPDVRIILLARTVGPWWRKLIDDPDVGNSIDAEPITLGDIADEGDRRTLLTDAYKHFHLAVTGRGPESVPPVLTEASAGDHSILALHAAALSVVLHEKEHHAPPNRIDPRGPLHGVLRHERQWWAKWIRSQRRAAESTAAQAEDVIDRILVVPALYPAGSARQAEQILRHALDSSKDDAEFAHRCTTALHEVYPSTAPHSGRFWDPLRPNRLGETLIVDLAASERTTEQFIELICRPFSAGATELQAAYAMGVLADAAGLPDHSPGNPPIPARDRVVDGVRALLRRFPETFVPAACAVAAKLAAPEPIIQIIESHFAPASAEAARRAAEHLPSDRPECARLAVTLWEHHLRSLDDDCGPEERAWACLRLAEAYDATAAADAALASARKAVDHYTEAIASGRHDHLADLAAARSLVADLAHEAGHDTEARAQITHAINDYRNLIGAGQTHHLRSLYWAEAFRIRTSRTSPTGQELGALFDREDELRRELNEFITGCLPETPAPQASSDNREWYPHGTEPILIPVGHSVGPLFTPESGRPDSYEIRFADGIFGLGHEELRVWALAHGDPTTIIEDPPRRDRIKHEARELTPEKVDENIDTLLEFGLLVELSRQDAEQSRSFAYRHQIEPLGIGLGNSADAPHSFRIGLPGTPLVTVTYDVYHLWMFAHRHASLWDAIEYMVTDRREEGMARIGVETDPHRLLNTLLHTLPALIATSTAYIDRVR
ncbi:P-loop NTPase [Nocardia blacklockiae]|uniref:P-loop NTPase n=1 Tax=Nocardia blacklockiae TaxID=480036 RepID=UPI0018945798|nr:hypothetical protein [Nocardia blacklockiae]MBF6175696.1 hypothetical protein [Nocardia blacklockiae]